MPQQKLELVTIQEIPFKAYKGVIKQTDGIYATSNGNGKYKFDRENICENDRPLQLCNSSGFHFSLMLKDVLKHVPCGKNTEYYEIEVFGEHLLGKDKGITKAFRFGRKIEDSEIDDLITSENMGEILKSVQKIQNDFPYSILGGSLALYLYGCKLERFKDYNSDIDISVPFYYGFENVSDVKPVDGSWVQKTTDKNYGNDFNYSFTIDDTDVDVRIDANQKYQVIEYCGFKYKVALLPVIIAAKCEYALKGQIKHSGDLMELMANKTKPKNTDDFIL